MKRESRLARLGARTFKTGVVEMRSVFRSKIFGMKVMLAEFFLMIALAPALASADPQIVLDMSAYKTTIEIVDGQEVTREEEATTIEPGQELTYRISFVNNGDEPATNVVLKNPLAAETLYILGSATGENIEFSADGGDSFYKAGNVVYQANIFGGGTEERQANPERYTHIRWTVTQVTPGERGDVSFKVKVN
ncbi:MAG: putative repeat protein (TIGR01451 family) [Candidatus Azotimanducaceae bacterium]|jgi:uncharacterized repeat protein (TIGR01451 family)